jgi:N-acetyltransferase 10
VPNSSGRLLKELQMQVPIRYGFGDPVEKWLNDLLCLDASTVRKITSGCPHPSQCNLYQVNRCVLQLSCPQSIYAVPHLTNNQSLQGHTVLLPQGLRVLPSAHDVALCVIPLQELA